MGIIILAHLFLLTMLSRPALAYLDPGSGSMLAAGLVGLFATLLFFLRGLYYKGRRTLAGVLGRKVKNDRTRHQLVFYSEGRQYWSTFRPLIDELVGRGERCLYLTSDEQDPGLLYSSELVSTKYIGTGTKAYAYLALLEADVCAMTTPGIGVLQIKRSKGVKHYAYLVHAPTDVGTYKQYSFDYFDSILISGDHQSKSIRKLEELRGTRRKLLAKTGCLYYDEMQRQLKELDMAKVRENQMTVLVASTWGLNGLLTQFGERVLIPLLERQWRIIVRPHPQSYISEAKMLDRLRAKVAHYPNLVWDSDKDGTKSMAQADVMVSDLSGIAFDFAFVFEKPVITLKFDFNKLGLEAADLPWDLWELTVLDTIGRRIPETELDRLPKFIEEESEKNDRKQMIRRLRDESVANFTCAAKHAANELLHIRDEIESKPVG
ncbi:MAG TPA: CDP-glycerol glycerophosphotransferase family protein [Nitrospira sp.]|nr:CDP-glycerol glycerophosphotransferase family protein [Nitrospira sp.]